MSFNKTTKVKEIAATNRAASKIFEEAGVDYCCGDNHSLQDACAQAGVSAEGILERLRANRAEGEAAGDDWVSAPLAELTRHIREKHHRYVRQAIPRVTALVEKVAAKHRANHPETVTIAGLFSELGHEMMMHMQKEEQILFPYIDALEAAYKAGGAPEPPFFVTVRNPVSAMMREHDSAGDLLKGIRAAASDFRLPEDGCASYEALYRDLRDFEADLHQHVHLENNILFPRAVEMEIAAAP